MTERPDPLRHPSSTLVAPPPSLREVLDADEQVDRVDASVPRDEQPAPPPRPAAPTPAPPRLRSVGGAERPVAPAAEPTAGERPSEPADGPTPAPTPAPTPGPSAGPVAGQVGGQVAGQVGGQVGGLGAPEDQLRHLALSVDAVAAAVITRMREAGEANRRHLEALEAEAARRCELLTAQAELDAELIRLHARREAHAIVTAARMRSGDGSAASEQARQLDEVGDSFARFTEAFEGGLDGGTDSWPDAARGWPDGPDDLGSFDPGAP